MVVVIGEKFTPSDLIQLPRPGIPVASPNGELAIYAQSAYNITEAKVPFFFKKKRKKKKNLRIQHIKRTRRLPVTFTF